MSGVEEDPPEQSACDSGLSMCSVNTALGTIPTFEPASSWIGSTVSTPTVGRFFICSIEVLQARISSAKGFAIGVAKRA
jgi:hypothetical protein